MGWGAVTKRDRAAWQQLQMIGVPKPLGSGQRSSVVPGRRPGAVDCAVKPLDPMLAYALQRALAFAPTGWQRLSRDASNPLLVCVSAARSPYLYFNLEAQQKLLRNFETEKKHATVQNPLAL
jgi:hypothetical protein